MAKKKTAKKATTTGAALRNAWEATVETLTKAEREMEKQVRMLIKKNKLSAKDAQVLLGKLRSRAAVERKRALKELEARLKTLQARIKKERKVLGKAVDEAVQSALAAFNIPSRQEVAELTRKVEELSRKIDSFKRRPAAPRRIAAVPAPAVSEA
jgi:hypothetical protein